MVYEIEELEPVVLVSVEVALVSVVHVLDEGEQDVEHARGVSVLIQEVEEPLPVLNIVLQDKQYAREESACWGNAFALHLDSYGMNLVGCTSAIQAQ